MSEHWNSCERCLRSKISISLSPDHATVGWGESLHPTLHFVARPNRMDERDYAVFLSESEDAMNYGRIPISLLEILGQA